MNKLLRFCFALALSLGPAFAVDWKALKPQGYVSDFAGVVDAASKAELENYCTRVEQQTGAEGDHGLDGEIGQGRRDAPQCLLLVLTSRAEGHENARPTIIAIPR